MYSHALCSSCHPLTTIQPASSLLETYLVVTFSCKNVKADTGFSRRLSDKQPLLVKKKKKKKSETTDPGYLRINSKHDN